MAKIKVTQIKSGIDRSERQKLTLQALGLNRLNAFKEVEATPQIPCPLIYFFSATVSFFLNFLHLRNQYGHQLHENRG